MILIRQASIFSMPFDFAITPPLRQHYAISIFADIFASDFATLRLRRRRQPPLRRHISAMRH
jgi:hypothetical protein